MYVVEVCGGVGSGLSSEGIIYPRTLIYLSANFPITVDSKSKCNATRHEWCTIETAEMMV